MKTIYSYYEHCAGRNMEEELRLILEWREHHEKMGLETMVLSEAHARKQTDFQGYEAAIKSLEGPQPGSESRSTFMRWLAMASFGGLMLQYNTFLYPQVWDDLNPFFVTDLPDDVIGVYSSDGRPAIVAGSKHAYKLQAGRLASCKVREPQGAITDADILKLQAVKMPESLRIADLVMDYGQVGWEKAIAVRYPRALLKRDGFEHAWRAVSDVRNSRYENRFEIL